MYYDLWTFIFNESKFSTLAAALSNHAEVNKEITDLKQMIE